MARVIRSDSTSANASAVSKLANTHEYEGLVGEYEGLVGEYEGLVGEYDGDVGEYDGDVGLSQRSRRTNTVARM